MNRLMNFFVAARTAVVAVFFASFAWGAPAICEESDFDQDGVSDPVVVVILSSGDLRWWVRNSTTGLLASRGTLGEAGDHIVLGNWLDTAIPEIGVAALDDAGQIFWKVIDEHGGTQSRAFGVANDTVVSGGDFNGDGITDAAYTRLIKKKVNWNIAHDLFLTPTAPASVQHFVFGAKGERVFYASPDGLRDWIGTVSEDRSGKPVLRLKNPINGKVSLLTRYPAWVLKSSTSRPLPMKRAVGTGDAIAFTRTSKGKTLVDVRNIKGTKLKSKVLPGTGDVIVGNFLADAGDEIAIKSSTTEEFLVYNPFSDVSQTLGSRVGIAIDDVNINLLRQGSSAPPPSNGGGGNPDPGPDPGPVQNCQSTKGWPGSHIYKTIGSTHFSPSDPRRTSAGLVIKEGGSGPFPSCLYVQDTQGNVLENMGLYSRNDGWEARYYAGIGCGASTALSGSAIGAKARANTGSSNIVINFGSVCYGPINATQCVGSSQC